MQLENRISGGVFAAIVYDAVRIPSHYLYGEFAYKLICRTIGRKIIGIEFLRERGTFPLTVIEINIEAVAIKIIIVAFVFYKIIICNVAITDAASLI